MSYLAQSGKNQNIYHQANLINDSLEDTIEFINNDLKIQIIEFFECGLDEDFAFENNSNFIECVSFNCVTSDNKSYYLRLYEDGSFNFFLSQH